MFYCFAVLGFSHTEKSVVSTSTDLRDLQSKIHQTKKPVVILLYATWCGHCVKAKTEFEKFARETSSLVDTYAIDAHTHSDFAKYFQIKGFPTIVYYPEGAKKSWRQYEGKRTASALADYVINSIAWKTKILRSDSDIKQHFLDKIEYVRGVFLFTEKKSIPTVFKLVSAHFSDRVDLPFFTVSKSDESKVSLIKQFFPERLPTICIAKKKQSDTGTEFELLTSYSGKLSVRDISHYVSANALPENSQSSVSDDNYSVFTEEGGLERCTNSFCIILHLRGYDEHKSKNILEATSLKYESEGLVFLLGDSTRNILPAFLKEEISVDSPTIIILKTTADKYKYHTEQIPVEEIAMSRKIHNCVENFLTGNIKLKRKERVQN